MSPVFNTFRVPWSDYDPCPNIALFGVSSDVYSLDKFQGNFLAFCMLLARLLILLKLKDCNLSISYAVDQEYLVWGYKKIKHTLQGSSGKIWQPFLSYAEEELELHAIRIQISFPEFNLFLLLNLISFYFA